MRIVILVLATLVSIATLVYMLLVRENENQKAFRRKAQEVHVGAPGLTAFTQMASWWKYRGVILYDKGLLLLLDATGRQGSDRGYPSADYFIEYPQGTTAESLAPRTADFIPSVSGETKHSPLEPAWIESEAWHRIEVAIHHGKVVQVVIDSELPLAAWELRSRPATIQ